ncbi:hypothetical protein J669_0950 [Acinetobacter baumannii 1295549]|nr:hypothetical protein J669_0950 [Acinetobacter baumannii 1295549]EXR90323.1 hypothetical protein J680_2660 [Acinetobacter baumannii 277047]EXS38610.1 hypothetical protein J677_0929 [Acinetobacter baumannii 426863]
MKCSSNDHDIEIFHAQYAEILQLLCMKNRHIGNFIYFFAVKISTKGAHN